MTEQSSATAAVTRSNPATMWDMAANGFSQISIAASGRLAFLSGQIAAPTDGSPMPRDVAGQAPLVVASIAAALDELGATSKDIVMIRIYVVDATTELFQQALMALGELLSGEMPSVTTIGVQALYTPEIKLEVEMIVRVP